MNSAWRHWGCTTTKIIENMKKSFDSAADLDGYEDLKPVDQARVDKAWEDGEVADEDIPETARKPEKDGEEEEGKAKTKKAPPKKKAKVRWLLVPLRSLFADAHPCRKMTRTRRVKRRSRRGREQRCVVSVLRIDKLGAEGILQKADEDDDEEKPKKKAAPRKKACAIFQIFFLPLTIYLKGC